MTTSLHSGPTILARALLPFLASLALITVAAAGDRPAISAKHAVELGEQALTEKGVADRVYIQSVVLQRTSAIGGKLVWNVTWSESIPASTPQKKEVGLEIDMNGVVAHVVRGPADPAKKHGPR